MIKNILTCLPTYLLIYNEMTRMINQGKSILHKQVFKNSYEKSHKAKTIEWVCKFLNACLDFTKEYIFIHL